MKNLNPVLLSQSSNNNLLSQVMELIDDEKLLKSVAAPIDYSVVSH